MQTAAYSSAAQPASAKAENPLLYFVQSTMVTAFASSQRLEAVLQKRKAANFEYPQFPLAQTLKSVADIAATQLGKENSDAALRANEIGPGIQSLRRTH